MHHSLNKFTQVLRYNYLMNLLDIPDKNLKTTLLGGQAFNWDLIGDSFYGFFKDFVIKISIIDGKYYWQTFPEPNRLDLIEEYFDLNTDYFGLKSLINKDVHIVNALNHVQDVRILNQDFEQTLLSFILTSHKNIKAVRKLVRDLSKYFGNSIKVDGITFYTFPSAVKISNSSEQKLRELGAGFRSRYLLEASLKLTSELPKFQDLSENEIRAFLTSFKGVGDKIADCVMVFSLKQRGVTPLDIWAKRVLVDLYGVDSKMNYERMRGWYKDYFGDYTAFAGQYLFEYYRETYSSSVKN